MSIMLGAIASVWLEAVTISLIGCVVGAVLGLASAVAAKRIAKMLIIVTDTSILLGFSVAASVGIFFGTHPANKAKRLRPIEASRYQ